MCPRSGLGVFEKTMFHVPTLILTLKRQARNLTTTACATPASIFLQRLRKICKTAFSVAGVLPEYK
jgi:hypothetical protein